MVKIDIDKLVKIAEMPFKEFLEAIDKLTRDELITLVAWFKGFFQGAIYTAQVIEELRQKARRDYES